MKLQISKNLVRRPIRIIPPLILAAILFNAALNRLTVLLSLPFFFDSIGTAVVAALLGPLPGIITGLSTNLFFEMIYGFPLIHYPFGLCGASTALIVGLMARYNCFNNLLHVVIASLAVSLSNSVLGAIIATFMFGGITGMDIDFLVTGLILAGESLLSATFWARIPANLIDKTIAVAAAFFIRSFVIRRWLFEKSPDFAEE